MTTTTQSVQVRVWCFFSPQILRGRWSGDHHKRLSQIIWLNVREQSRKYVAAKIQLLPTYLHVREESRKNQKSCQAAFINTIFVFLLPCLMFPHVKSGLRTLCLHQHHLCVFLGPCLMFPPCEVRTQISCLHKHHLPVLMSMSDVPPLLPQKVHFHQEWSAGKGVQMMGNTSPIRQEHHKPLK